MVWKFNKEGKQLYMICTLFTIICTGSRQMVIECVNTINRYLPTTDFRDMVCVSVACSPNNSVDSFASATMASFCKSVGIYAYAWDIW